jgi:hypothetical protein
MSGRRSTVGGPAVAAAASATILQQQHADVIERVEKFLKENDLNKMPSKKSGPRNASGRLRMLRLGTEFYMEFKSDPNASLPDGWLELEKETCPYGKATAEYLEMKVSQEAKGVQEEAQGVQVSPLNSLSVQGVQAGGKALRTHHINGMVVRKKRPRGFKKRPRGFK